MSNKFDIYTFFKNRPLSWSSLSAWEYDKEEWYRKYMLGEPTRANAEMIFGKKFAYSIEKGTCKVPGLLKALQEKKEHEFAVMFGKIKMTGFADAFCDKTFKIIDEVKTGVKPWDKKRADGHGQFDMYCLMNFITNKVRPEDTTLTLYYVPTVRIEQENGDFSNGDYRVEFAKPPRFYPFRTSRSMAQVLAFGAYINETVEKMQQYVREHVVPS